jgi:hypothetical protein
MSCRALSPTLFLLARGSIVAVTHLVLSRFGPQEAFQGDTDLGPFSAEDGSDRPFVKPRERQIIDLVSQGNVADLPDEGPSSRQADQPPFGSHR